MMTVVIAIAAVMAIFRDIGDKLVNLLNEAEFFIKYPTSNDGYC
jgi:hypothetical protein